MKTIMYKGSLYVESADTSMSNLQSAFRGMVKAIAGTEPPTSSGTRTGNGAKLTVTDKDGGKHVYTYREPRVEE